MRGSVITRIPGIFLTLLFFTQAVPGDLRVIKNPRPNMKESRYVPLKRTAAINPDLGNDEFIFGPFSLSVDRAGHLFVYDRYQAKIFKLDRNFRLIKCFGRKGQGPGEFSGTGKAHAVYIKIGRDGKLYAHDLRARKIIVFTRDGDYIRSLRYRRPGFPRYPVANPSGTIYYFTFKDEAVVVNDEKESPLFSVPYDPANFDYLFFDPGPFQMRYVAVNPLDEVLTDMSLHSHLFIYFKPSSTMLVLDNGKIIEKFRILPEEALRSYESELSEIKKRDRNTHRIFFSGLIVDEDEKNLFYLNLGKNTHRKIRALYQFNLKGELVKVLYLNLEKNPSFIRFEAKSGGRFYAIEEDTITIYREE